MNKLARKLNTVDATLIVMGGIIGAGIFANPSVVAQVAHTPALIVSVWLLGGLIALTGGFIFAELAWRRPDSGGLYGYLRDAFHPLVAFEYGWTALLISQSGGLAAAGIVFANYFGPLVHLNASPPMVAVSTIIILSAINCLGVREGSTTQNVIMLLKIAAIGALIAAGIFGAPASAAGATAPSVPPTALWAMIGAALIPVLFAYDGWQTAPFVDHELRDTGRALPIGMIGGVSAVVVLYLAVTIVGLRVLGAQGLAATSTPASDIMRAVFGTLGQRVIAVGIALSTLGFLSNNILTSPRIYYAMARDRLFFRSVGSVHPRTQAPVVAIVLQAAFACAITLWKGYYEIIGYVTAMDFVFLSLAALAIFVFRSRGVHGVGGMRVPGHPITTVFFIVAGVAVIVSAGPTNALFTLIVLSAGAAAYGMRERFARSTPLT
ncbi:MAG: amino acid transporter [Candidatus Meridianibacter frigidus]|nr:MAG: amino acid transporter [Candidatus Eremiobacteraeota bacterium]